MSTSPCKVTDPRRLESTAIRWKRLYCTAMGCESGRQDSSLRRLVPQTSPHFPMSAEFDLEWFCGELVGMTTRARVMESAGIAERSTEVYWAYPSPLCSRTRPHTTNGIEGLHSCSRVYRLDVEGCEQLQRIGCWRAGRSGEQHDAQVGAFNSQNFTVEVQWADLRMDKNLVRCVE